IRSCILRLSFVERDGSHSSRHYRHTRACYIARSKLAAPFKGRGRTFLPVLDCHRRVSGITFLSAGLPLPGTAILDSVGAPIPPQHGGFAWAILDESSLAGSSQLLLCFSSGAVDCCTAVFIGNCILGNFSSRIDLVATTMAGSRFLGIMGVYNPHSS